jgi:hypothetical protein
MANGMLLAIACLGHMQQRPGSDLHQLRAEVLHWLTSPGLPAEEVLEVTRTWSGRTRLPMTLVSCSVLDLHPLFATPTLPSLDPEGGHDVPPCQAHRRFVVQALRHIAATWEQVDSAVTTFVGCFGRLWRVPWENGYKEVF